MANHSGTAYINPNNIVDIFEYVRKMGKRGEHLTSVTTFKSPEVGGNLLQFPPRLKIWTEVGQMFFESVLFDNTDNRLLIEIANFPEHMQLIPMFSDSSIVAIRFQKALTGDQTEFVVNFPPKKVEYKSSVLLIFDVIPQQNTIITRSLFGVLTFSFGRYQ